ncbi:thioesterase [Micromonospora craniellae]|uniref:Thioesterase n=2 Tax=Micromonospora craniellae TaxID=2294034 RepID=A0A372G5A9_9ACTN|nr:thioesterase [Micromonospora craniellae]RFS47959.1 thioesterase [Micromonospora craniellae]
MYAPWSALLPEHVEVRPVQLPGRGDRVRDRPRRTLPEVLDVVLDAVDTREPYALFGHSLGALLAFEVADRLRERPPVRLFVSGHRAPHLPDRERPIRHLPDEEFVAGLAGLGGIPEVVLEHPEFLRMLLPAMRADLTVAETYRYRDRPVLDCPISVFGGSDDPTVIHDDLIPWIRHTTDVCRITLFPGNHFYLTADPRPVLSAVADGLAGESRSMGGFPAR